MKSGSMGSNRVGYEVAGIGSRGGDRFMYKGDRDHRGQYFSASPPQFAYKS